MDASVLDIDAWLESGTVISSRPGNVVLAWGKRQWLPTFDPFSKQPVFYFPDFSLKDEKPWFDQPFIGEFLVQDLLKLLESHPLLASSFPQKYQWDNPYFGTFQKAFWALQTKIRAQELNKAVPYVFEITPQTMNKFQMLRSLIYLLQFTDLNPVYIYGFWDADQGVLGATPELLFQLDGSLLVKTMACAGTIENGTASTQLQTESAFMQDPKEVHEHNVVIEGIEESLKSYGTFHKGNTQLLKLAKLTHLMTPLEVHLNEPAQFEKIVHALHPTPALGAFPRDQGMVWLKEYQNMIQRRRFGAPAGYLFPLQNQGVCYVSIRNVQWDKSSMCIGAGCGVVGASDLEREWTEINLKLRSIKEMLAL